MEHSFDVEIAKEYGIESAIILKHLSFWIQKNMACEKHCFNGIYWTYSSVKAFRELFPYMGEKQIRNNIDKLKKAGLIIVGEFNKSAYDRTKWYAITDAGWDLLHHKPLDLSKGQMSFGERANGNVERTNRSEQKDEPIPDIITDIITDIIPDNNTMGGNGRIGKADIDCIVKAWNSIPAAQVKNITKIVSGTQRYEWLIARAKEYGVNDILRAIENIKYSPYLQGNNNHGWTITFDWFVRPNNFPKVLDGNYGVAPKQPQKAKDTDLEPNDNNLEPECGVVGDDWMNV